MSLPLYNGDSYTAWFLKFELAAATANTLEAQACRRRDAPVDQAPREHPSRRNFKVWQLASAGSVIYNDPVDRNPAAQQRISRQLLGMEIKRHLATQSSVDEISSRQQLDSQKIERVVSLASRVLAMHAWRSQAGWSCDAETDRRIGDLRS